MLSLRRLLGINALQKVADQTHTLASTILKEIQEIQMTNAELLAALQADSAEIHDIAGKVQTLLDTINNAANVPQDVVDAANELKTGLDNLSTEAGG